MFSGNPTKSVAFYIRRSDALLWVCILKPDIAGAFIIHIDGLGDLFPFLPSQGKKSSVSGAENKQICLMSWFGVSNLDPGETEMKLCRAQSDSPIIDTITPVYPVG